MQLTGIILILMAILGKIGATFCIIPEPIIGGLGTVSLGAVFGESSLDKTIISLPRFVTNTVDFLNGKSLTNSFGVGISIAVCKHE